MHRIVLVDDHPAMLLALRTILERDVRLQVVGTAGDGGEGLKLCRELKPDVLIVDIDIPGLNGLDLIRRIRVTDSAIKILVISSYAVEVFSMRCQTAGANGYVSKNEDVSHVLSAVTAVLAGFNCFRASVKNASGEQAAAATVGLSDRELTVLRYLARGLSNKEIGDALALSNKTISTHKANILGKLGLDNVVALAAFAKTHQLI